LVIELVPNLGPLAAFVRNSSILCRASPATYARLVARTSGEVMLPRTADPRSQIISRSCTDECSACANLSRRGCFRLNILNTADPILEREPPSSALGGVRAFAVAWERLLSARLLPFGQPALSAQLRRPRPRSATGALRRDRTSRAVGALTLSAVKRTTRWSKTKRRPAKRRRPTTDLASLSDR